jgi:hypothetical protein
MIKQLKKIQAIIKINLDKFIEIIALHFVFIFGIGITHVFAKLFSKKFLSKKVINSNWEPFLNEKNPYKMY